MGMGICFKLMIGDGCVAMLASVPFANMEHKRPPTFLEAVNGKLAKIAHTSS